MKNKVLAMLLALCMVMSLLPVSVFATGDKVGDGETTCETCGCAFTADCGCKAAVEEDTDNDVSAADAVCGCETAKTPCGCEGCKADACQEKEKCADPDCTQTGNEHVKGEHTYPCACKKDADGKPEQSNHAENATTKVKGTLCDECYKAGHSKDAPVCTESSAEDDDCALKGVEGATHTVNCVSRCTGKNDCDSEVHTEECPIGKVDGEKVLSASYTAKTEIACMCNLHHVDGSHGAMLEGQTDAIGCPNKVTITKEVTIVWEPKEEEKKEDAAAGSKAADPLPETEDDAKKAADDALAKEIDDQQKDNEKKKTYLCDACKAAQADVCDGTLDCEAQAHTNVCLTQCNMGKDCPNEAGNAAAHKVLYLVDGSDDHNTVETAFTTRTEAVDYLYGKEGVITVKKDAVAEKQKDLDDLGDEADDSDVEAAEKALAAAKKELAAEVAKGYVIIEKHCEKLGIPDSSTVVSVEEADAAGNGSDDKTDETPTKAEEFADMVDWAVEGVQYMLDKGWMEGMGDGTFGVTKTLKTTQVLTVLGRMNDADLPGGANWEADAKAWAEENAELFEGIDLESDSMARKDIILVLWRQAGKPDSDFELEFTDIEGLEGDHLTAMKWAVENKIVQGNGDGTVSPDGSVTRGQLSLLVMRAFNNK